MRCSRCGKEIRDGAEDCPYCGRPTSKKDKALFNIVIGGSIGWIGCMGLLCIISSILGIILYISFILDIL